MRLDPDDLDRLLDAVTEHVEQCRAAVATAREGDPTALQTLPEELDAMAEAVAELRGAAGPSLPAG